MHIGLWRLRGYAHGLMNASELRSQDCPGISGSRPNAPPPLASSSAPHTPAFLRGSPAQAGRRTEKSRPPTQGSNLGSAEGLRPIP